MGKSELFVYIFIFVAVVVFNYLMKLLARRARQMQEQQQAGQEPAQQGASDDDELDTGWGRSAQPTMPAAPDTPRKTAAREEPPVVARAARRGAARELFRSRASLRQAIVVMTVLGPCRAIKPHD